MNTRSTTASRKRRMIVDLSSENADNTSYLTESQTGVEESLIKEKQNIQNDLKKNEETFCSSVFHEESNTKTKSPEQLSDEKDDFSLNRGVTTRSSSRPGKRQRAISPPRSVNTTPESSSNKKRLKSSRKPLKRQWESWGPREKDVFFEALLEHSKDFDKIRNYLMKRRGDLPSIVKNKEQVRHFYYRALNKIAKYVPEKPDLVESQKTNYEVHCLICYGELRKKFRCLKEKDGKKLTELIATGKTTIRYQTRNLSIRAPVCRALKKQSLNIVDEVEHVPTKIMIELVPGDNGTWSVVQALAQNPRLRTTVSSRKTLYNLLVYLKSKWKLDDGTSIILSPATKCITSKTVLNKRSDNCENAVKSKQSSDSKSVGDHAGEGSSSHDKTPSAAGETKATPCSEISKVVNERTESLVSSKERQKSGSVRGKDVKTGEDASPSDKEQHTEKSYDRKDSSGKDGCLSEKNCVGEEKEDSEFRKDEEKSPEDLNVEEQKWDLLNCNGITIADVLRKLGCPRKLFLCYNLTRNEPSKEVVNNAMEQLVKLAMGEFCAKTDAKNATKKDSTTPSSSKAKESVSKRVSKPSAKTKLAPKLAPKLMPEPSLVIPAIVPSVLNQISASTSTRTGNHVTFGFTPISSFATPSPFLPCKSKMKNRKSHVVVQRTLLPRPFRTTAAPTGLTNKQPPSSCSPVPPESLLPQPAVPSPQTPKEARNPVSLKEIGPQDAPREAPSSSSATTTASSTSLSVESFFTLALTQGLSDNVDKLLSVKPAVHHYDGVVCTEELDSGVSGGTTTTTTTNKGAAKEASSLVEAIEDLHNHKFDHCVEQPHHELLENLKSSEDEDPLKLFSSPHGQHFNPEWLNEESSDFSLSNIFDHMDHSPTKHKTLNVLDTPKKGDFRLTEGCEPNVSKYLQPEPVFCDLVDESSVDYVKKFRDLAKKMTSESDVSPPSTSAALSFKSLLSETTTKD